MGQIVSDENNVLVDDLQKEVYQQSKPIYSAAVCTYEEFLKQIEELNKICKDIRSSNGRRVYFVIQKGSDNTAFWKMTVRVVVLHLEMRSTPELISKRLLTLRQFLRVYTVIQEQFLPLLSLKPEPSPTPGPSSSLGSMKSELTVSMFLDQVDELASKKDDYKECCICLERKPEVVLPCTHSYCLTCIEHWNSVQQTCPICREQLKTPNDSWVIQEIPGTEDMSQDMYHSLLTLIQNQTPTT